MRENKTTKLIEHLIIHSDDWVSAKQLSIVLGVSTRQVRKYISAINNTCEDFVLIYSGKQGYRLDPTQYEYYRKRVEVQKDYTPQQRYDYIIQKLIVSPQGYDIFNLSDELYVSIPTIERDLKHIREFVKEYQLTINRDRDSLILNGKESDKRSIMGSLLSSKEYNSFVLSDKVQLLSFHYHLWEFRTNIYRILSENKVFCNDYTLNDIALHLIIMIDRIRNNCMLTSTVDITPFQSSDNYHVTQEIVNYIENEYEIKINNAEFYQLLLIITNNSITVDAGKLTPDNLDQFIDKSYIEMTETILSNIEQTYYLEYFDPTFKVKMALHLWALFRRVKNNTFAKNPLTNEVKSTYPLIYDIAVFFAQQLKEEYNLFVNEDEIAYLAFHIGSYFENTARNQKRLNCMFVYVEYHNTQQITMERIQQIFEDKIDIKHVVPISMYQPDTIAVDLVISTVDLEFPCASVIVSPFITEKELSKLRIAIDKELQKKRKYALISYLQTFVDERLFYVNARFKNQIDSITTMGNDAIRYGYVNEGFVEDVFDREKISSTVFGNVAVPHALSTRAKKGFIAFAISDSKIKWNEKEVNMVVMLGISKDSRKSFAEVFDYLIDIISEKECVEQLESMKDYHSFIAQLIDFIDQKSDVS